MYLWGRAIRPEILSRRMRSSRANKLSRVESDCITYLPKQSKVNKTRIMQIQENVLIRHCYVLIEQNVDTFTMRGNGEARNETLVVQWENARFA